MSRAGHPAVVTMERLRPIEAVVLLNGRWVRTAAWLSELQDVAVAIHRELFMGRFGPTRGRAWRVAELSTGRPVGAEGGRTRLDALAMAERWLQLRGVDLSDLVAGTPARPPGAEVLDVLP